MYFDEVADLNASWREYPPLCVAVSCLLGGEDRKEEGGSLEELMTVLGG